MSPLRAPVASAGGAAAATGVGACEGTGTGAASTIFAGATEAGDHGGIETSRRASSWLEGASAARSGAGGAISTGAIFTGARASDVTGASVTPPAATAFAAANCDLSRSASAASVAGNFLSQRAASRSTLARTGCFSEA